METEETIHDMRDPQAGGEGVVLIVRQHNKYGPAHAGEKVRVDASELLNRSTMEACMTLESYEKHRAAKAAKKSEAPKSSQLKATVDVELKRIQDQALERERKKAELAVQAPPATEATRLSPMKQQKKQK